MNKTASVPTKSIWPHIDEAHARLHTLEQKDRRHWFLASTIMVALAVGLFSLSLPGVAVLVFSGKGMTFAVRGLLLLVLLFAVQALRRQRSTAQSRRELASELAIIAASETLKIAVGKPHDAEKDRRELPRLVWDERLAVTPQGTDVDERFYGRIIDICEHGLGAIVSGALTPGQAVTLQFSLQVAESERAMKLAAVVRQRNGFRYGFSFTHMSEADREQIEALRAGVGNMVRISAKAAGASESDG